MYDHILIPADGSDRIDEVVERASALVSDDGELHSIHVVDIRSLIPLSEDEQRSVGEALKTEGEKALDRIEDSLTASVGDVPFKRQIVQGIPSQQILGYAQQNDIDAIVLGTHGQTARNQAIGSTTERVVRGTNLLDNTDLIIVPLGPDTDEGATADQLPEQAKEMFQ